MGLFTSWIPIAGNNSSEGRTMLRMQYNTSDSLFYVELPGGAMLYHEIQENERFPIQFGREVRLNKLMNDFSLIDVCQYSSIPTSLSFYVVIACRYIILK